MCKHVALYSRCIAGLLAEAIKLTMKILTAGRLVKKTIVYGIVVATHQLGSMLIA